MGKEHLAPRATRRYGDLLKEDKIEWMPSINVEVEPIKKIPRIQNKTVINNTEINISNTKVRYPPTDHVPELDILFSGKVERFMLSFCKSTKGDNL